MNSNKHFSVMLDETIKSLEIKPDGIYVDLTAGMGGHSKEILTRINSEGHLFCFDKDDFAIHETKKRLSQISNNFTLIKSDFASIKEQLAFNNIKKVDGIIADLGISSPQIDNVDRGFSYSQDSFLDMRMDQQQKLTAYEVVNSYNENQLINILYNYADVKLAKKVAKAIVNSRPISSTLELVEIIKKAYPSALLRQKNPAKAIFQAIRIEVNNEYDSIHKMLKDSIQLLKPNGHLAIISFHSGEDKIVKNFFGDLIKSRNPKKLPIIESIQYKVKVLHPSSEEIIQNNRSRSAKLRVLTKLF